MYGFIFFITFGFSILKQPPKIYPKPSPPASYSTKPFHPESSPQSCPTTSFLPRILTISLILPNYRIITSSNSPAKSYLLESFYNHVIPNLPYQYYNPYLCFEIYIKKIALCLFAFT